MSSTLLHTPKQNPFSCLFHDNETATPIVSSAMKQQSSSISKKGKSNFTPKSLTVGFRFNDAKSDYVHSFWNKWQHLPLKLISATIHNSCSSNTQITKQTTIATLNQKNQKKRSNKTSSSPSSMNLSTWTCTFSLCRHRNPTSTRVCTQCLMSYRGSESDRVVYQCHGKNCEKHKRKLQFESPEDLLVHLEKREWFKFVRCETCNDFVWEKRMDVHCRRAHPVVVDSLPQIDVEEVEQVEVEDEETKVKDGTGTGTGTESELQEKRGLQLVSPSSSYASSTAKTTNNQADNQVKQKRQKLKKNPRPTLNTAFQYANIKMIQSTSTPSSNTTPSPITRPNKVEDRVQESFPALSTPRLIRKLGQLGSVKTISLVTPSPSPSLLEAATSDCDDNESVSSADNLTSTEDDSLTMKPEIIICGFCTNCGTCKRCQADKFCGQCGNKYNE